MTWVDSIRLQNYLACKNIFPVKEVGGTAYYIYNDNFKKARESYRIERLFNRSHLWEY